MTVTELESKITMQELEEWAELSRVKKEERDRDERIRRVECQARANRGKV